jgi:hypothetical protein
VPAEELAWPTRPGPVLRHRKLQVTVDERPDVTSAGGLILPLALIRRFGIAEELDSRVQVFKKHLPYHESDHVLSQALMLYLGGTCLEDMSLLQGDPVILKMLDAARTPDPTTAGDFLRRITETQRRALRAANDAVQMRVWKELRHGRRWRWCKAGQTRRIAVLHLDGHLKEVYGTSKEGADFSYKGRWSLQALVASLEDGECVGVHLGSGSERSSTHAAALLQHVLPHLRGRFDDILVVADSDFDRSDVRDICEAEGVYFAFVAREYQNRLKAAESLADAAWEPFRTRAHRQAAHKRRSRSFRSRRSKPNRRRACVERRGYDDLRLTRQWLGECQLRPQHRMVIRKQLIEEEVGRFGQRELFEEFRYRYIITNLPDSWSASEVVDITYRRCDQENVIEQLGSGLAMWRMPVAELHGNAAWLEIARLAWNLGKWVAKLALPAEVSRWEWKRFRRSFVHVAVQVLHQARRIVIRILGRNRHTQFLLDAYALLQP